MGETWDPQSREVFSFEGRNLDSCDTAYLNLWLPCLGSLAVSLLVRVDLDSKST